MHTFAHANDWLTEKGVLYTKCCTEHLSQHFAMDNVYVLHKGHNVLPENFCNSLTSHHAVSAVLNSSILPFDCDNSFRTLVIMGGTAIVNAN